MISLLDVGVILAAGLFTAVYAYIGFALYAVWQRNKQERG